VRCIGEVVPGSSVNATVLIVDEPGLRKMATLPSRVAPLRATEELRSACALTLRRGRSQALAGPAHSNPASNAITTAATPARVGAVKAATALGRWIPREPERNKMSAISETERPDRPRVLHLAFGTIPPR
jgi:hypothetical protein